ncbi:uncharacterized protein MONOS_6051 [Monocercomonoides exilis]|uniref:uncharacterized protein n=1 Tax=Monocercomonoides exilis TaxID=2049356 RepID=UPI003559ECCF|nr:hypothetical protein MONOS_6051 [Monocercomonoides exilis]|eukprot:MONOS_6051.1-p1 / transcript=MONOS_6051.1 / gene=MONOS_6051 / organism=Monocercomonoides_exilis_PA203 / gene_product=unspecified product / transcript_product=unspecified product / location=Mono_scaffold00185:80263-81582(-) / protein_length=440 / sequence_SO=supercontig / SO=protein_coding / is_pseudo=false
MYVRSDGLGDGCEVDNPSGSLSAALNKLCAIDSPFGYGIKILHNVNPLVVSPISLGHDLGLMIEGVNCSGENNTEVVINCDGSISTVLFSCQKSLEFKYLAFQFSATKRNWNSLISAGSGSISLTISTCRFVRIGSQAKRGKISNDDGNSPLTSSLVSVTSGSVEMDTVKCTDETSFVAFSSSPFSFSGAREVSLSGMDISKVNVESGAVISINDGSDSYSKVSIEGLNVLEVKSEKGAAAGLDITLSSKESRVAIGRSSKCSFKSCSAPEGKSGAIFIDMPKATSNLQLPSANNLEIDSSNTAGSESTSLFIIAPDFDEFCKQEDAFEFANDYDDSAVGWVEGTKDADTEPEDVYEKYIKGKKDPVPHPQPQPEPVPESEYYTGKKDKSKTNSGVIIVAVIVPLIVVIAVVVFVIVILYKKRSVNKDNNEKEQEMKDS